MAKNQVYASSRNRSLPVADGTVSGDPVVVGSLVGVALTSKGEGGNDAANATVALDGAFDLTVSTAVASVGTALYMPSSGKKLTTTATDNTLFGYALATKTTGDGVIVVEMARV